MKKSLIEWVGGVPRDVPRYNKIIRPLVQHR